MGKPRTVLIRRVNFLWYLVPILPILLVGWLALVGMLPSWALLVALFAFFMWLFSLLLAVFAALTRRPPPEPRQ